MNFPFLEKNWEGEFMKRIRIKRLNKNNTTGTLMFLSLFATIATLTGNIASYIADKPKLQFLCLLGTIVSFPCLIASSIPDFKKGLKKERD